ncbi:MAG: Trk system potassium transporter TrkA [Thermoanaerobaculales bacterium]|jgi:trk system potassium uptake protein TrkA|nr:Trk system potassium transporter TrkA [Thermoanaerobaculales bacterium]
MKNSENILILGLGGVGDYLAKRLSHEGHAITIVEQFPDAINRADGELDARLIRGDAMRFSVWLDADARTMDYLIAVTDDDAVNIIGSLIADRFGIRRKIARVRSLALWEKDAPMTADDVKIDLVIRPEELAAREIARLLKLRAGNMVFDIAGGHMQVVGTRIDEGTPLAGMRLEEFSEIYDHFYFRVVSIARGINTIIPGGEEQLLPGDNAFILARTADLSKVLELARETADKSDHRVMIVGGGLVGSRVAEILEKTFPVRLLERDPQRAEELSYRLKHTEILNGNGSEVKTLLEAGLLEMDTIVAATSDNETNIMSCVMAKNVFKNRASEADGASFRSIALVGREEYLVMASTMGADVVLSKKVLAANEILKYIRRGELLSVAHLHGLEAEVVELVVGSQAPITRKPLHRVEGTKGKIIIGGFSRGDGWHTAVGSTHLQPGDKVVAICTSDHLRDLQRLVLG